MLTNSQIKALKPKDKIYLLADTNGLYIQVKPNGKKTFLHIYTQNGKRVKKVIGEFDPKFFDLNKARLEVLQTKKAPPKITTQKVIDEWLEIKSSQVNLKGYNRLYSMLSKSILKNHGKKPFDELKRGEIVESINKAFDSKIETKKRTLNAMKQVYNYAVMMGYAENNILFAVIPKDVFGVKEVRNFATITDPKKIKTMFEKVANSNANPSVKLCLALNALTALRPGNIIALKWQNVDFKKGLLEFSPAEMKTKKGFILPLNLQALRVLEFIHKYLNNGDYVFASPTSKSGHISDNTTRKLLRDLGIKNDEFTPHGFRAMFSTIANEHGKDIDTIERCLAHRVGGVRGVYDRSHKLEAKRELMAWWGEYLAPLICLDEMCGIRGI